MTVSSATARWRARIMERVSAHEDRGRAYRTSETQPAHRERKCGPLPSALRPFHTQQAGQGGPHARIMACCEPMADFRVHHPQHVVASGRCAKQWSSVGRVAGPGSRADHLAVKWLDSHLVPELRFPLMDVDACMSPQLTLQSGHGLERPSPASPLRKYRPETRTIFPWEAKCPEQPQARHAARVRRARVSQGPPALRPLLAQSRALAIFIISEVT